MEYIEGVTLERKLKDTQARVPGATLDVHDVVAWGLQIADVLAYLHTQEPPIIFRDLKPANVMLQPDNNIRLIDFGIARRFQPGASKDTALLGSVGYSPPEQFGHHQTDVRSDVYAFGATLHHLLTGIDPAATPFKFVPARQVNAAVPQTLSLLIEDCVLMDVDRRPSSINEVALRLLMVRDELAHASASGNGANISNGTANAAGEASVAGASAMAMPASGAFPVAAASSSVGGISERVSGTGGSLSGNAVNSGSVSGGGRVTGSGPKIVSAKLAEAEALRRRQEREAQRSANAMPTPTNSATVSGGRSLRWPVPLAVCSDRGSAGGSRLRGDYAQERQSSRSCDKAMPRPRTELPAVTAPPVVAPGDDAASDTPPLTQDTAAEIAARPQTAINSAFRPRAADCPHRDGAWTRGQ